jgi:ATP-dependent protease HslVU (ClpYQ) peptidase subunit
MSIVVVVKDGERVCMASDSEMRHGNQRVPGPGKLVRLANGVLVGHVGSHVYQSAVKSAPDWPVPTSLEGWALEYFCPWVWDWFKARGLLEVHDGAARMPGACLLAWRGEFAMVDGSMAAVRLAGNWWAIGSGEESARGALFATDDFELTKAGPAERRAWMAVAAACHLDDGCGPPICVEWTDSGARGPS